MDLFIELFSSFSDKLAFLSRIGLRSYERTPIFAFFQLKDTKVSTPMMVGNGAIDSVDSLEASIL